MGSRYDNRVTTFSPEGRLQQVEYAREAISEAGSAVGIHTPEGIVLIAEKRITSKLLDVRKSSEKLHKIDDHCCVAVAGLTADANILINYARLEAQRYTFGFRETIPVEQLLMRICDLKQSYTQYGGLRPFGVSFLFAGWDEHFGFQLYQSEPSGVYSGWKAQAIGKNHQSAQSIFKTDYKEDMKLDDALMLGIKVLSKTMDTTSPTPDKVEVSTVTRDASGAVVMHQFSKKELEDLCERAEPLLQAQKDEEGDM